MRPVYSYPNKWGDKMPIEKSEENGFTTHPQTHLLGNNVQRGHAFSSQAPLSPDGAGVQTTRRGSSPVPGDIPAQRLRNVRKGPDGC